MEQRGIEGKALFKRAGIGSAALAPPAPLKEKRSALHPTRRGVEDMKRSTYRFGAAATVAVIAAALFVGGGPSAQSTPLPFTFYLTHYELLGDMNNPSVF